jgi:hypothetical protein
MQLLIGYTLLNNSLAGRNKPIKLFVTTIPVPKTMVLPTRPSVSPSEIIKELSDTVA